MFNATFNNISVISWWSVLLVEETGVPGENHRPVTYKLFQITLYRVHLAIIGLVLWCLMPLTKIFQLYRGSVLLVEETRVPGEYQ